MVDDPDCLLVAWVDLSRADGAIGRVDVTNRRVDRPLVAWARYQGGIVKTPAIDPSATFTQTFRGNAPRAGDVAELGYY
jgi:hypothetical protein